MSTNKKSIKSKQELDFELEDKFMTMRKFYQTHVIILKKIIEENTNFVVYEAEDRFLGKTIQVYVYESVWKIFDFKKTVERLNKLVLEEKAWQIQLWTLSTSTQKYALDIPPMDFLK